MSYTAVDLVMKSDLYRGPTKWVLAALAEHLNAKTKSNEVWPGYARLQLFSVCSRSVVKRAIDRLTTDGIIEVLSPGVGSESTHYLVYLGKLETGWGQSNPRGGVRATPRGVGETLGVGSERPPKQEGFNPGVSQESQAEEERPKRSAASSPKTFDPLLVKIVESYGKDGNAVEQLLPLLEKHKLSPADLVAAIAWTKKREDPFMRDRIRKWPGFIKCLTSGGFIDQWRNPSPKPKGKSRTSVTDGITSLDGHTATFKESV